MFSNPDTSEPPFPPKAERTYLEYCHKYPEKVIMSHESSVVEGFQYLYSVGFSFPGNGSMTSRRKMMIERFAGDLGKIRGILKLLRIFPKIIIGLKRGYRDIEPYLREIKNSTFENIDNPMPSINNDLWEELNQYSAKKWDIFKIGFTELPTELIFKDKMVLFRYALVFVQEMKKEKIDQAPLSVAGREVMRVYATLGQAVNGIARWLRKKEIRCQSNHPLGGLVCTPPLAGKAGMGWQGRQGMLITPEFGPRQRIAPIFIEKKIFGFTDNLDHIWIENQCKTCGLCQKNCPANAIHEEKQITINNIPGIGAMRTCIEREKCFPYFLKTAGCSICIKVCPFSNGKQTYEQLKSKIAT
ncbi:MAG: 4Fe-4S double cluster binding domain-containing protein [Candidatus Thorarchaeota archaeon]